MRIGALVTMGLMAFATTIVATATTTASFAKSEASDRGFKQRCAACHSVIAGKTSGVGPNLKGVVGRKSAATSYAYSPAMKKADIVWNKANLDRYLTGPAKMIPGTKMVVSVPDKAQRAEIIAYLTSVK